MPKANRKSLKNIKNTSVISTFNVLHVIKQLSFNWSIELIPQLACKLKACLCK
jgi:hypothetical protein